MLAHDCVQEPTKLGLCDNQERCRGRMHGVLLIVSCNCVPQWAFYAYTECRYGARYRYGDWVVRVPYSISLFPHVLSNSS